MYRNSIWALFVSAVCATGLAAQQSTPQTTPRADPQMTSSAKAQPIVISGCVGSVNTSGGAGATPATTLPKYSLGQLQYGTSGSAFDDWAKEHASTMRTTGASGGPITRPTELMLNTPSGSKVELSQYVGQNIEVTGTIGKMSGVPITPTTGATGRMGSNTTQSQWPPFNVTAVKVLSTKCS